MRSHAVMFCLILAPASLLADALSDAKAALHKLQSRETVQVQLEYRTWRQSGEDGKYSTPAQAQVGARLTEDARALHVEWDTPLVEQVEEEARRHDMDPKFPSSLRDALKDLDPGRLHHLLNQGPVLEALVSESRFVRETVEPLDGKAARLLVFSFEPRVPSSRQGRLSMRKGELKLWIDGEGNPLAAESNIQYQGKMSRFFGAFSMQVRTSTKFERIGSRLVATSRTVEEESWDSGYATRIKSSATLSRGTP